MAKQIPLIIGGIALMLALIAASHVPEEPTAINLTAADCAAAPGKCYVK